MGPEEAFAPHSPDVERLEGQGMPCEEVFERREEEGMPLEELFERLEGWGMPFEELFERREGEIAEREGDEMRLEAQDRSLEEEGTPLVLELRRRKPSSRRREGAFRYPREVIRIREAMTKRAIQKPGPFRWSFTCRALRTLRAGSDSSQVEVAAAAGIPSRLLSDYENGRKELSEERLATLATALGYSSSEVIAGTRDFLARADAAREDLAARTAAEPRGEKVREVTGVLSGKTGELLQALLGMVLSWDRAVRERDAAQGLWDRLRKQKPAEIRALLDQREDLRTWALCELLCNRSLEAARDRADRAVELAELASWLAERISGEEAWCRRVQGFAWAHLGNARRVHGDLEGADEAFRKARKLWKRSSDPLNLLARTRLLELHASLRRDQGRLTDALTLLDRALEVEDVGEDLRKSLLISKAAVLEALGNFGRAIDVLSDAALLAAKTGEARLLFALRFNMAVNHGFLGHHAAVEAMLPKIRRLATARGDELDLLRVRWLEGRIAAVLGRRREAVEAFSRVREGFAAREIAYDAALASLELAVLYLEDGRAADVRLLARQMVWIFRTQGLHPEVLAALRLFCEAAERNAVTLNLVRRLVRYLYRAPSAPQLRFEEVR
jgi:tetratricopeptide (TPR) repeat protein